MVSLADHSYVVLSEDDQDVPEGAQVATLTAWKFDSPTGADAVLLKLKQLEDEALIQIHDAAVASWPEGRRKPWTREEHNPTGRAP